MANGGPEIEQLIQLLARLPGLGPRSARRAVLHLIKKKEALMIPLSAALDRAVAAVTVCASFATRVLQGALEKSNVSGIGEMTEMIRVSRAYQSLASLMQRQDEMRRSAVQRLGDANA